MENITIIGAGQLGSRHLQALALHENELAIYLVDPIQSSLDLCESRFKEVDEFQNKKLYLKKSIKDLPSYIEFAVIATNSLQRLSVLKDLLHQAEVKYLLLEKFLFPYEAEYTEAASLIKEKDVITYVNCSRRMWPNYRKLKEQFIHDSEIKLTVSGPNWNMGSNAIHFFDLFFYLCNEKSANIDITNLDQELLDNKRAGYIEISGTLSGITENGHSFCLTSTKDVNSSVNIAVESNNRSFQINESEEKIYQDEKDKFFKLYHQSELTNIVYEQLIETGTCHLVPFDQSITYHLILLKAFNKFLNGREGVIT